MQYDPLKDRAANLIRLFPTARVAFYRLLDLILLRQRYVKRCMLRHAPDRKEWLYYDAGAGFCQYSWFVLKRFSQARVLATDLKREYLEDFADYAAETFPGRFCWQEADLQVFTPQNKYHVISAVDILEHIPDDYAVLRNFYHCLAEGGVLIISTPSDTDPAAKFTAEHVRPGYAKAALESKLRKTGFTILESLYSYGKYGSLAWRMLLRFPLSVLGKSKTAVVFLPFYFILIYPIAAVLMRLDMAKSNKQGTGIIIVAQKEKQAR